MFVSDMEEKYLLSIEKRNKLIIKQVDIDGNEVVRQTRSSRGAGSSR
jgi:hypothetical protein